MPANPTVLIADDAPMMRAMLAATLRQGGFERLIEAEDGPTALNLMMQESPDLVILDVSMPGMSGFEVVEAMRSRGLRQPVLMLTTYDDLDHRVQGLAAGADDYLSKGFDPRELLARMKALLRRANAGAGRALLKLGPATVDLDTGYAEKDGRPISLTPTEIALLTHLARAGARPVSREELLDAVWGYGQEMNTRTVEMHVCRLRKKICAAGQKPRWLVNRFGLGYVLRHEAEDGMAAAPVSTAAG